MLSQEKVKVRIIQNPSVTSNELDFHFDVPQQLGGLKREITVKRNKLRKAVNSKSYNYTTLSNKLGLSTYNLRRFLNKETVKPDVSETIYNAIYSTDLDKVKEDTETNFNGGENKNNIRHLFYKHVKNSGKLRGHFFTLPSDTCTFENELNIVSDNKFHYLSAEHDKDTFMKARKVSLDLNLVMSLNLGEASEILLSKTEDTFSHIFLDYCGTFTTYENEVRYAITNNLVKTDGLIGLTFTTREANTKQQTCIDYHRNVLNFTGSKDTPSTIGGIRLKLLSFIGNNYKIVEFEPYKDGSHMVFVLLKRVK